MTTRSKYFGRLKGGVSLHCEDAEDTAVRFILLKFGEDTTKAIAWFWKEYHEDGGTGSFTVVPLFSFGSAPRIELCSQQSLATALQSVTLDRDSLVEKAWKEAAEELNVAWPVRLSRYTRKEERAA
jgi:hypothetical protein